MVRLTSIRSFFPMAVGVLYIILFVYAATDKLLGFQQFKIQLGQSPLLVSLSNIVVYAVPLAELVIAILLCLPKFRLIGLYAAMTLMSMFTVYIVIILNFSPFVPCACGGVLDSMGWTVHLVFNLVFVLLAVIAILLHPESKPPDSQTHKGWMTRPMRSKLYRIGAGLVSGILALIILYHISSDMVHHRNGFVRLLPPHPTTQLEAIDLGYNSFYFSGRDSTNIYLGNLTAPLYLKKFNPRTGDTSHVQLEMDQDIKLKLRANTRVGVLPPYFYIMDGVTPRIWRGSIGEWKSIPFMRDDIYFNDALPIGSGSFVIRAVANRTGQNELGILSNKKPRLYLAFGRLKKQMDGIFCTDGILNHSRESRHLIYLYHYRNEYMVMNDKLDLLATGKTIDTNSVAKIGMETIDGHRGIMAAPPLMVNKRSRVLGNLLFVHSGLMAQNEDAHDFKNSDVIDIYDLSDKTYGFSFYIPRFKNQAIRDMWIEKDRLMTLHGTYLVVHRLEGVVFNEFFNSKTTKVLLQ